MSLGLGEPKEKVRAMFLEKMIQPVGRPPAVSRWPLISGRGKKKVRDSIADFWIRWKIEMEWTIIWNLVRLWV